MCVPLYEKGEGGKEEKKKLVFDFLIYFGDFFFGQFLCVVFQGDKKNGKRGKGTGGKIGECGGKQGEKKGKKKKKSEKNTRKEPEEG